MTTATTRSVTFDIRCDYDPTAGRAAWLGLSVGDDGYTLKWGFDGIASGDTADEMLKEATAKNVPEAVRTEAKRLCVLAGEAMKDMKPEPAPKLLSNPLIRGHIDYAYDEKPDARAYTVTRLRGQASGEPQPIPTDAELAQTRGKLTELLADTFDFMFGGAESESPDPEKEPVLKAALAWASTKGPVRDTPDGMDPDALHWIEGPPWPGSAATFHELRQGGRVLACLPVGALRWVNYVNNALIVLPPGDFDLDRSKAHIEAEIRKALKATEPPTTGEGE